MYNEKGEVAYQIPYEWKIGGRWERITMTTEGTTTSSGWLFVLAVKPLSGG